ncbi:hypothetical protein F5H01DRAFT_342598 [Linnemannia elongata]|nr:hypothetical protein F5H01DRAFT_342598 [Linnemannia elongata]
MTRIRHSLAILLLVYLCSLCITCVKAVESPVPARDAVARLLDGCKMRDNGGQCVCDLLRRGNTRDLLMRKEWRELTRPERCLIKGRCQYRYPAQCCIDLCEKGSGYICENENDCKRIDQTGRFFACKADQKCEQWSYSGCSYDGERIGGVNCFCRKYNKNCANA